MIFGQVKLLEIWLLLTRLYLVTCSTVLYSKTMMLKTTTTKQKKTDVHYSDCETEYKSKRHDQLLVMTVLTLNEV